MHKKCGIKFATIQGPTGNLCWMIAHSFGAKQIKRASFLFVLHTLVWYIYLLPLSFSLNEQSGSFCLSQKNWWTINTMMLLFWRSHIEKKRVIPDTVIPNKRFLVASLNCGQTTQSLGWYLYYASDTQHYSATITQKSFCSCVVQKMCIMLQNEEWHFGCT